LAKLELNEFFNLEKIRHSLLKLRFNKTKDPGGTNDCLPHGLPW